MPFSCRWLAGFLAGTNSLTGACENIIIIIMIVIIVIMIVIIVIIVIIIIWMDR